MQKIAFFNKQLSSLYNKLSALFCLQGPKTNLANQSVPEDQLLRQGLKIDYISFPI